MESRENDFNSDDESIQSSRTGNFRVTNRKSREELNEIEKQRTRRINEQILSIRGLLDVSNFSTRKDKYSVLCSAYEFIVRLKKTIDEYRLKLGEKRLSNMNSDYSYFDTERIPNHKMTAGDYQNDGLLRNGYDHLLKYSRSPMALMTIDANFVSCNESFCSFTGFSREELLVMSLFNLSTAYNLKLLFKSVGTLIDQSGNNAHHIWNQFQFKYRECLCFTSLWLVDNNEGNPAFIQLMLVPGEECVNTVGVRHTQGSSQAAVTATTTTSLASSQETYDGGNSGRNALLATEATQDDMITHKQKCVAMLRQKFAEQQATNPNSSLLPLLKIKQEYEKIQQQEQQQHFQAAAEATIAPPLLQPPPLLSSKSSWFHSSQSFEETKPSPSPSQHAHHLKPSYVTQLQAQQQQQQQRQLRYLPSQYNTQQMDHGNGNEKTNSELSLKSDHHQLLLLPHKLFSTSESSSLLPPPASNSQNYDKFNKAGRKPDRVNGAGDADTISNGHNNDSPL